MMLNSATMLNSVASLMALWTLGSAGMLLWGIAAAIPLVIHLWNRRRYQETAWAAMDFLLASLRTNARRLRFEQWVLLALRMLLLLVLATALADPLVSWPGSLTGVAGPKPIQHVLVLDTSYSMAFRHRDRTRLDAAVEAIRQWIKESHDGDSYCLVLMQNPPSMLIAEPVLDRGEIERALEQVRVSHGGADLRATFEAAQRLVDEIASRNGSSIGSAKPRICFFTDLGRTTWQDASQEDCRELYTQLISKADLSLIDVGQDAGVNYGVTNIRVDKSMVTTGEAVRMEADVQAFGAVRPESVRVQFLTDGQIIDEKPLTLPVSGKATADSEVRLNSPGDHALEARLSTDSLDIDNQRWVVVPVRKSLQVLCVQGEPDAADYVALALNPEKSADAAIHAEIASERAILDHPLSDLDCIILNNVARISADEARSLQRFVTEGGGLVTVLGDLVQADSYNRQLGEHAVSGRVLPAELGQIVRDGERFFDPRQYRHPIVAPFQGHERAGLLTVPTWRYFKLNAVSATAKIALAFDNGDPAVVEDEIGAGRCLLVATSLSPSSVDQTAEGNIPWSALPTWPSFPPLVHGLVRAAIRGRESNHTVTVLSPLVVAAGTPNVRSATVTLPDGTSRRTPCTVEGGQTRCAFDATTWKGIYRIQLDIPDFSPRLFAVNVDPRESDLRRVAADSLPDQLRPSAVDGSAASLAAAPEGVPLFRIFLGAVAVLMLFESTLACWFARRAA